MPEDLSDHTSSEQVGRWAEGRGSVLPSLGSCWEVTRLDWWRGWGLSFWDMPGPTFVQPGRG